MDFKKITFLISLILISFSSYSQDYKRKTERLLNKSEEALGQRDWPGAVRYLEEAISIEPQNHYLYLEKASLLYTINDLPKVLEALQKAFSIEENWPARYTDYYFILGKESFDKGKYEQAKRPLEIYEQRGYKDDYVRMSKIILKSIDFALSEIESYQENSNPVKSINSESIFRSIYFPFFTLYPSEFLYFTGQRVRNIEEGIYRAKISGTEFQKLEEVPVINSKENEGAAAISADGRVMVFTSCNRRDGFGSCDLYISYYEGDAWQKPVNLGEKVNTAAWESQPFLSSDGRFLLFSSNRRGGYGKRDLYYSLNINGEWSRAKNLGSKVNTFADEISPFLKLSNDSLFFSSNGRVGMGGFDLYKTAWPLDVDSIENVGLPINTYNNELSFHEKFDGDRYWSRELDSDAKYPPAKVFFQKHEKTERINLVFGEVTDATTEKNIKARIQIYDLELDSLIQETYSNSNSGLYQVIIPKPSDYSFYVEAPGYLFTSRKLDVSEERTELNFKLKPIKENETVILNNIYFEFDSYELSEKSKNEINKIADFLINNPQVKIEIGGYTDLVGSKSYNKTLSQKRANAVYNSLLEFPEIEKDNISARGYGAEKLPTGEFKKTVVVKVIK
ncbi:OmpA family protein [Marivirga arenosa]|uniref:OmpA family protein n=1 Tax=Marivirga arenosa TaxID=3059076 RepID=A0AA51N866_9BACT|nr:OmpA family protein [Marivirga sp. ABR2-2]WMN07495.1 OmpA family protein [Marivirga sp. ABR2-2]